jgi:hypothetical protein
VGYLSGPAWLGVAATAMALVAALLNAVLRFCLGCRLYGVCNLDDKKKLRSTSIHTNQEEALV